MVAFIFLSLLRSIYYSNPLEYFIKSEESRINEINKYRIVRRFWFSFFPLFSFGNKYNRKWSAWIMPTVCSECASTVIHVDFQFCMGSLCCIWMDSAFYGPKRPKSSTLKDHWQNWKIFGSWFFSWWRHSFQCSVGAGRNESLTALFTSWFVTGLTENFVKPPWTSITLWKSYFSFLANHHCTPEKL